MTARKDIVVQVVLALPTRQQVLTLQVPHGTTAREVALQAARGGLDFDGAELQAASAPLGIYSERVDDEHIVGSGDRVEIYRPLQQDPMILRRKRAEEAARKKND